MGIEKKAEATGRSRCTANTTTTPKKAKILTRKYATASAKVLAKARCPVFPVSRSRFLKATHGVLASAMKPTPTIVSPRPYQE